MARRLRTFNGNYLFLSNFYMYSFKLDGQTYSTVEHYFQSRKALDGDQREWVCNAITPREAKRRGREVALRSNWEKIKLKVMHRGLQAKFSDPVLRARLLATEDWKLTEGNKFHDNYWGDCLCSRKSCMDKPGENHLGKLLMDVRREIRKEGR